MNSAVEFEIDDIAFGGKGVGRLDGKAVFVPFTIEGERVAARIVREKKNLAEAELETVLAPSPHRTTPECPYFGECGGCTYQHISYEHQLAIKAQQVEQTLRRIARLAEVPMQPIVPSPVAYAYRNRITVHALDGVVGYFRREAHQLIDVEQCPIAAPAVNRALAELRARRPRDGHYTLRAHEGPRVFAQTNDAVAEALARHVVGLMTGGGKLLVDAYCGAGFFAKRLTSLFERVLGLEWDRYAVALAQKDAAPNESYIACDAGLELRHALLSAEPASTSVIVDPPEAGLTDAVRRTLLEVPVNMLVYVSCNPATLARDLAQLHAAYATRSVTPFDMFPQTAEVEVAVELRPLSAER
ncbi:MAG TPA: TRAM domain-containing protein [Chthoniobacterales bacterium]|nr:TRAM domain-containing protein [Chthoniobacterales bacterium]